MANKKEKIVILGASGSGKDFLMRKLSDRLKPCLKCTTRPMRTSETQSVEYDFINESKFLETINNDEFIVHQKFTVTPLESEPEDWYYGITEKEFNNSQICIMTPGEYNLIDWTKVDRKSLFVVYLDIDRKVRESRLHNREDKMDSIKRRLDADEIDFKDFDHFDLKVRDPDFTADDIYELME